LIALLTEFFPEYATVWGNVTCASSLELLKTYTFPSDIMSVSKSRLLEDIVAATRGRESDELMAKMLKAANRSVGVREGLNVVRMRISNLADDLTHFDRTKVMIDAELETVMDKLQLGKVLQSMPGVGTVVSAGFIGEIGDISRFSNWKQVRRLAGYNLVKNSSGQHKSKTKISKRGRPYLRYILYTAGESACLWNPEMQDYYRYLMERKHNPLKRNQALVAVGLKVMRILFHLAKTGEAYDPNKALGEVRIQQIASLGQSFGVHTMDDNRVA
jgi:transposase